MFCFYIFIPANLIIVGLELLLRKFKYLQKENSLNLTNRQKKVIYILSLACFICCLVYLGYMEHEFSKYSDLYSD